MYHMESILWTERYGPKNDESTDLILLSLDRSMLTQYDSNCWDAFTKFFAPLKKYIYFNLIEVIINLIEVIIGIQWLNTNRTWVQFWKTPIRAITDSSSTI